MSKYLQPQGALFVRGLKASLDFLARGGEIKTVAGRTIVMDEFGRPGFMEQSIIKDSEFEPSIMRLFLIGSPEAWGHLIYYAERLTDKEIFRMSSLKNVKDYV